MTEGTLVLSTSRGRYAIATREKGPFVDLTSGQACEIQLGGQWIAGSIECSYVYALGALPHDAHKGYFFVARDDSRPCGLCVGMHVRIP